MKHTIFYSLLMTLIIPVAVFSQELDSAGGQRQRAALAREVQMREREIELQQREAEMNFQQEMRELELEEHRIALENQRQTETEDFHPLLLLLVVINILCAIWVYQDIQKRTRESGIWIVIALLTGLLGTLVYAVVRLVNSTKQKS